MLLAWCDSWTNTILKFLIRLFSILGSRWPLLSSAHRCSSECCLLSARSKIDVTRRTESHTPVCDDTGRPIHCRFFGGNDLGGFSLLRDREHMITLSSLTSFHVPSSVPSAALVPHGSGYFGA
jgi:hypothetical protein